MRSAVLLSALFVALSHPARAERPSVTADFDLAAVDWPWWRGPTSDGVAPAGQQLPLNWSKTENVVWKAAVPGRGHASPTVVGDAVYLATADEQAEVHSVLCYDRATGRRRWKTDVHRGGLDRKGNKKASQASSTVACDGRRLLVNFLHDGAVYTTALDLDGKRLWQTKIVDFATHQGFGSSPFLYQSLAFVAVDSKIGGAVAALDRKSGEVVWSKPRPKDPNYTSPIVLRVAGRDQLLVTGCELISSFDPLSGKKLWEVEGATTECVTTTVTDGERVFVSGGYPRNHTQAVEADGSGRTAWQNKNRVYVPSMLVHDGHLYAVLDAGVAVCYASDTGREKWKQRLGGTFSASLVLVGDDLLAVNESGEAFIFKADPAQYRPVAENRLGDEVFATPAVCGGRIYHRVAEFIGQDRQEMLYCLGTP